ncbi:MAG: hypothetical protein IKR69_05850 [Bacteroidales bacterium]|nr:hypothetical protein [Bacteroidales bacterium]
MMKARRIILFFAFSAALLSGMREARAQLPLFRYSSDYVAEGDSLHREYRFEDAVEAYHKARVTARSDAERTLAEARLLNSQNAIGMTSEGTEPVVVATERFSREDFFLYFPLPRGCWHPGRGKFPDFLPKGGREFFFADGGICRSELRDSLWTRPVRCIGADGAAFPLKCGRKMYFSSDSLFGMGGYDLYVSVWNEEKKVWGEPESMGFPFSSTGNDYLAMDTDDGLYTIFASDRDCPPDSINVYVVEADAARVRKSFSTPAERRRIASLKAAPDPSRMDHTSVSAPSGETDTFTQEYRRWSATKRAMRDSVRVYAIALEGATGIAQRLVNERLSAFRDSLNATTGRLREIEMRFLRSGIVPDFSQMESAAERKVVGVSSGYTFTGSEMGGPLKLQFEAEVPDEYKIERSEKKKWWEQ